MENKVDWEGIAGWSSMVSGTSSTSSSDSFVGESAYEMGSGRMGTFDTTSDSVDYFGDIFTENPVGSSATGGTTGTGSALYTFSTTNQPEEIEIFFRRDCVPYSRVEKNAVSVFNMLHKEKINFGKTAIIAKSLNAYNYLKKLFCKSDECIDIEKITAIEGVLERMKNEQTDN